MDDKSKLIQDIIEDVENDMSDEDIIHMLLDKRVSTKLISDRLTAGDKAADGLAKFAGSWKFIIIFGVILVFWMIINSLMAVKFDPYPFILLNLVLSCIAAIQAPIIMMSQNRQEQKDRQRSENDYRVNVKTEIIIDDLHQKLDKLIENQESILRKIDKEKENKEEVL